MSITYNSKVLIKRGSGSPGTALDLGELGFDYTNNRVYIGTGVGNTPIELSNESEDAIYATNASVGIALQPYATNSSVGLAIGPFATNSSVGIAIKDFALNSSVNNALLQKLNNTTDTFTGTLTVNGSMYLIGNFYQNGSTFTVHAENLNTYADYITLREGAVLQIPDGSVAGFRITKADGTHDLFVGCANDAVLRVGWSGHENVALAAREDSPINGYYAIWDNSSTMFKTSNLKGYIDGSIANFATNASVNAALSGSVPTIAYGGLFTYENYTMSPAFNVSTGYRKMYCFTNVGNNLNVTSSSTNQTMTISQIGRYLINFNLTFQQDKSNTTTQFLLFYNDVSQNNLYSLVKSSGAIISNTTITGILNVDVSNRDIYIGVRNDAAAVATYITHACNLSIHKIT